MKPNPAPRQVPLWVSLLVFFGMLIGAMALVAPDPKALVFAFLFPLGICALFGTPLPPVIGVLLCILSYVIYLFALLTFMRVRTWGRFSLICFGFACLLLLNVAGCR